MKFFILVFVLLIAALNNNAQVVNQPANWPNSNWSIGGTYSAVGLLNDPTNSFNFTFDDDVAGVTAFNIVHATSPIIDLTIAHSSGETFITVEGDAVFRPLYDNLHLQYWDADGNAWRTWYTFPSSSSNLDYQTCTGLQTYSVINTTPLNIEDFSSSQLSGFKYRFYYEDYQTWNWGFCMSSPTIKSSVPPACTHTAPYNTSFEMIAWPPCFGEVIRGWNYYDWKLTNHPTPSSNTGPSGASIPSSIFDLLYFHVEPSAPFQGAPPSAPGTVSRLQLPPVDISSLTSPTLTFEYHMYGASINKLFVEVSDGGGSGFVTVDSIVGQQQTSSNDPWLSKTIDLSAFTGIIQLGFTAAHGSGPFGDVAIDDVSIDNSTGINENNISANLEIFPNPNKGQFEISVASKIDLLSIRIYDLYGRIVFLKNSFEDKVKMKERIDLSEEPKGLYMVEVITDKGSTIGKVVVK